MIVFGVKFLRPSPFFNHCVVISHGLSLISKIGTHSALLWKAPIRLPHFHQCFLNVPILNTAITDKIKQFNMENQTSWQPAYDPNTKGVVSNMLATIHNSCPVGILSSLAFIAEVFRAHAHPLKTDKIQNKPRKHSATPYTVHPNVNKSQKADVGKCILRISRQCPWLNLHYQFTTQFESWRECNIHISVGHLKKHLSWETQLLQQWQTVPKYTPAVFPRETALGKGQQQVIVFGVNWSCIDNSMLSNKLPSLQ